MNQHFQPRISPYCQSNKHKYYRQETMKLMESSLEVKQNIEIQQHKEQNIKNHCYCCYQPQPIEQFSCQYCNHKICKKCIQQCDRCSKMVCRFDCRMDFDLNMVVCQECQNG